VRRPPVKWSVIAESSRNTGLDNARITYKFCAFSKNMIFVNSRGIPNLGISHVGISHLHFHVNRLLLLPDFNQN
jgi:hypothetical protein